MIVLLINPNALRIGDADNSNVANNDAVNDNAVKYLTHMVTLCQFLYTRRVSQLACFAGTEFGSV